MKPNRFALFCFSISCMSLVISSIANTNTNIEATTSSMHALNTSPHTMSVLYVLRAGQGVVAKTADGYILKLTNMDPKTLWFADRPYRYAGLIPTNQLISGWAKPGSSFQITPASAAFIYAKMEADKQGVQH